MNAVEKKKRFRAANFTSEEIRLLIRLALKEKRILENKQTDSEVWKLKDKTWKGIAEVFNASSGQTFRSVETLRLKYDGLKKELKKKVIKNKAETMKTGGGNPDYIVIDGPEKELLKILSLSVNGLSSAFDSDSALPQTTITGEKGIKVPDVVAISEEELQSYPLLNADLQVIEVTIDELTNDDEVTNDIVESSCFISESEFQPASDSVVVENIKDRKTQNASVAWKDWSPGALKSKKHPLLTPRRKNNADRNSKIDNLLELREELVRQQINHTQQEERRAQEMHERKMELLNLQINKEKNY